jgi:hypothetical protein
MTTPRTLPGVAHATKVHAPRALLMRTMRMRKASNVVLNKVDNIMTVAQINASVLDGFGMDYHRLLSCSALLEHVSNDLSHTGQLLATAKMLMEMLEWAFHMTRRKRARAAGIQIEDCGGSVTIAMVVVYIVIHLL